MNWLKNEWNHCIVFYRKEIHRIAIITGVAFFAVGALVWLLLALNTDVMMQGYTWLMSIFESKGMDIERISAMDLFKNNTTACMYGILIGFIPFFYLGVFSLIVNASSIGIIGAMYSYKKISMLLLVAGIVPHGIFELPSIFISLAMGFITCKKMSQRISGKCTSFDVKEYSLNLLRVFVFIVLPMLLLAAIIEAYITPVIMNLVM